ncbi:MAG: FAD-dependent monooxygenase [Victivallales bacterium]|nr:FAD-dependent monooxygenase [Victivallales bacterium]
MKLELKELKIPVKAAAATGGNIDRRLQPYIAAALGIAPDAVHGYTIRQKSLDARKKGRPQFIYRLEIEWSESLPVPAGLMPVHPEPDLDYARFAAAKPPQGPLVVGTGPAGLMTAWLLASNGCRPVIIDRGFDVDRRHVDIDDFFRTRQLSPDSNFLYGEGGAGTYSDGKLYTRIRDPRSSKVLELFVNAGAPEEIAYLKRPHIGSDILPAMVKNLRRQIVALGGTFLWGRHVVAPLLRQGRCAGVRLADGETLTGPATFLNFGLSARELIAALIAAGIPHEPKGFQLGVRIEHPQELIDRNQYGMSPRPSCLGAAEYNFVSRPEAADVAGVSSFCMCPGGEIVPATATPNHLSTNGMSRYRRDGEFANSCLIVTFRPDEFADAAAVFARLRELEATAFTAGGGDYTAPAQDAAAFLRGEAGLKSIATSYRFGLHPARLDTLLPPPAVRGLQQALLRFDRQCPGFVRQGKLVGIETHVSSPVRFLRRDGSAASPIPGLYLAGEGAGFAGGIISAAVDGLRVAEDYLSNI